MAGISTSWGGCSNYWRPSPFCFFPPNSLLFLSQLPFKDWSQIALWQTNFTALRFSFTSPLQDKRLQPLLCYCVTAVVFHMSWCFDTEVKTLTDHGLNYWISCQGRIAQTAFVFSAWHKCSHKTTVWEIGTDWHSRFSRSLFMLDKSHVICEMKPNLLTSNGAKWGNVAKSECEFAASPAGMQGITTASWRPESDTFKWRNSSYWKQRSCSWRISLSVNTNSWFAWQGILKENR